MNVLLWHVHGSWTTAFVEGAHQYFLPVTPDRGPDGRGRAETWEWPANAREVPVEALRDLPIDVAIAQRPHEVTDLIPAWLGRYPGLDLPTVYLEHNTPPGPAWGMRHPVADRCDLAVVHVTACNALFWDTGDTRTRVIEHGIVDPGYRYTGDVPHLAVVINEAARRGRVTGTDLLGRFRRAAPVDLYGMGAAQLGGIEGLTQPQLHDQLAQRRVCVHPNRWTSLSLSLIEAMQLGLPVVAVGTTAVVDAVPASCGFVSTDVDHLVASARALIADREWARVLGANARVHALERFGLDRFLQEWDEILEEVAA
jgi:hypothetical protein